MKIRQYKLANGNTKRKNKWQKQIKHPIPVGHSQTFSCTLNGNSRGRRDYERDGNSKKKNSLHNKKLQRMSSNIIPLPALLASWPRTKRRRETRAHIYTTPMDTKFKWLKAICREKIHEDG